MGNKTILTKNRMFIWILILLGSLLWSLTMIKSGLIYDYGMGFWGPNGHDGVWHVSLAGSIAKGNWGMPIFAGESIKNYHIGFDFFLAVIYRLTFIPINNLYFQVLPPLFALGLGISVYLFVHEWTKSKNKAFWAVFFTYFSGSFGWIITWIRSRQFSGESMFWSQQPFSSLVNPPYAMSLIVIFIGFYFLIRGVREKNNKYLILSTFLFGLLIQIKVYAGILTLCSLFIGGIYNLFTRKGIAVIKVFTGSLILSILVFNFFDIGVSNGLVLKPFWFLETMMSDPGRLNWQKYAQAMINYRLAGNWIKGVLAYSVAFTIFIIGNFGIRVLSFSWFIKKCKNIKTIGFVDVSFILISFLGILIPTLFIQNGTSWNTIQFFYYTLAITSVMTGIVFGEYLHNRRSRKEANKTRSEYQLYQFWSYKIVKYLSVSVIMLLSIPVAISTLRHYLPNRPPSMISNNELKALKFLAKQPDGVILVLPFDRQASKEAENNPPRPLYLYETCAYVSAFTGKPVYMEDEVNLEITRYEWRRRRVFIENNLLNPQILKQEGIRYIYIPDGGDSIKSANVGRQLYNEDGVIIIEI